MLRLKPSHVARLTALALGITLLASCAPQREPAPEAVPPERQVVQPLALRVLDARDRPLAQVAVTITPKLGKPQNPGPYLTDMRGVLDLPWLPQVKDELAHLHSSDRMISYNSSLSYRVEVQGYLPVAGAISTSAHSRSMKSAELAPLSADLLLGSRTETVVLRRPVDLLGQGLKGRPAEDALVARCLEFFQNNHSLASRLGAEFAWPTFALHKGTLTLNFEWRGVTWGGLRRAPLASQVALNAGVPLVMAAGLDLVPTPGVERVSIEFHSELPPEGDEAGAPRRARVVLQAPAAAMADLAAGKTGADAFLKDFPPQLVIDKRLGE